MNTLHFAEYSWLWGLCAVPAIVLLYAIFFEPGEVVDRLKTFADAHLLPHLIRNRAAMKKSPMAALILWSALWAFGMLAMAGPRWNFIDVEANRPERELVILLDLSKSMDAQDVKPSRLERAKQEIADILDMNHKVKIGLVAFAVVPHMVVPVTEDMATLRTLLPYLETDLVHVQGSRLKPAIDMATGMLGNELGDQRSILIVSDGEFEDTAAAAEAIKEGINVYALGIGTDEGAPIPAENGDFVKDASGQTVMARLETGKLDAIAEAGHGLSLTADYSTHDTRALMDRIGGGLQLSKDAGKTVRIWDEKFWIPALAMALCLLPLFRKGYVFPLVLFVLIMSAQPAHAEWTDLFRNRDQQGQSAFDRGDYEAAAGLFGTPYRRGVAEYKAKKYDEAAKSFAEETDPQRRLDAEYNLGNAQLMANHPDQALARYEAYLKERPDDKAAQHNLEVARKLLEQQQQKPQEKSQDQAQQQDQQSSAQSQPQTGDAQSAQQQKSATPDQEHDQKPNQQPNQKSDQRAKDETAENSPPKDGGQNPQTAPSQAKSNEGKSAEQQKQQDQSQSQAQSQSQPSQTQHAQENPQQGQPPTSQQAGLAKMDEKKKVEPAANQQNQSGKEPAQKPQSGDRQKQTAEQPTTESKDSKPQPNSPLQSDEGNEYPVQNQRRMPEDVDADQWLSRVVSDPGPFLKNKFLMEERRAGAQSGDDPW